MRIHCNPSKSLKPSNEVDIQNTQKRSFYILGDTQTNLHQFTCCRENDIIIYRLTWYFDLIWFDLIDQQNILLKMMYWHRAWEHEYDHLLDTRPRAWWMLYSATTSKNLLNNLKSNLPHSKFLDQEILGPTPGPFSTGALRCSKIQPHYNRLASTPASPITQYSKFKRLMAAFVLRTAAIACQKHGVHPIKVKTS